MLVILDIAFFCSCHPQKEWALDHEDWQETKFPTFMALNDVHGDDVLPKKKKKVS
jgi:hypothetical protein